MIILSLVSSAQDTVLQPSSKGVIVDEKGSPVVLLGDTLFKIHASYGAFSAKERADALSSRLMGIVREEFYYPDSLVSFAVDQDYYIMYREQLLMAIRINDTIGTGLTQEEISDRVITILNEQLAAKSVKFNFTATLKNIGYTALVVFFLILIIWILNRVFRIIFRYAEKNRERFFKSIKINEYEFLTADQEFRVATSLLKFLKIVLIIVSFLVALPLVFSIFPTTEGITRRVIAMIWDPVRDILMAIINYIPEFITIIIIYLVFKYLIRFVRFLAREVESKELIIPGFYADWAKPTFNIIRVLLYAFMFIIIFPYLPGSSSPAFQGVSVFLGILISLGSTSLVGNAMAGLVITYMRPYKVGDRIKIDDIVGDVVEKSLMITRVRTIKNEEVTIPNSKVLSGYTVNYSSPTGDKGLIIYTTVTIGYDAPWRTVHELLIRAASITVGVIADPKPFVLQTSLDDFYISYQVNAYIKEANFISKIKSDLHQNIQDEFNRAGVEIMSPAYEAQRDGGKTTIPEDWGRGDGEKRRRGEEETGRTLGL
jgi:small-conductance mechanosensitive channel